MSGFTSVTGADLVSSPFFYWGWGGTLYIRATRSTSLSFSLPFLVLLVIILYDEGFFSIVIAEILHSAYTTSLAIICTLGIIKTNVFLTVILPVKFLVRLVETLFP